MALNKVTLICDLGAGQGYYRSGGTGYFTPSAVLTDAADHLDVDLEPIPVTFSSIGPPPSVQLLATDNANLLPAGWGWVFTPPAGSGMAAFTFFLPYASGATQYLSAQTPVSSVVTMQAYMPLPSGTPSSGQAPLATGTGEASAWGNVATNPMTTSGDTVYGGSGGAFARLAGDTSNTRKFLREQSSAGVAQPPAWDTIQVGDLPLTSLGVYDVKSPAYGAVGNGITDDTAACNAASLACHNAGGGTVLAPPGFTFLISAPLVVYSNTRLVAYGATFTLAANSNCNMIQNFAVTPNRSVADAAITTGTAILTSATAAFTSADVGATVAVAGANQAGQVLTANIVSVTNGTTVVLDTNAQNTVTAAACSIYYRDSNIEIAGGTWNRNNNGYTAGGTPGQNTTQLRFIDGLYVHDMSLSAGTAAGYQLAMAAVTNFTVKRITVNAPNTTPNTDGVSVVGPAIRGVIDTVYGADGDDFIALHTNANQGTNSAQVVGNISDILVTNIFPNGVGQGAVKINSSTGQTANAITVRTVHGTYTGAISFASQQSNITDILFEDIDVISPAASGVNLCYVNCPNATTGTLTFRNVALRSYAYTTAINMFQFAAGSNLGTLILENLTWEAGTTGNQSNVLQLLASVGSPTVINNILISKVTGQNTAAAWTNLVLAQQYSTIGTLTIKDVTAWSTQAGNYPLFNAQGAVQTVILDGIYLNGGGELVDTTGTASAMQIIASNIVSYAAHRLFKINSGAVQTDIMLTGVNVNTLNQAGLINIGNTSPVITVRGGGLLNPSNVALFNGSTPTTPARVVHEDARVDVATIATNLGDRAWNTNAASAVLGPVFYDGTKWDPAYQLLDATATDITADGNQAAGSVGKAADAGHVHPANQGYLTGDQGLLAQTFDVAFIGASGAGITSGTVYLGRLRLSTAQTITNLLLSGLSVVSQSVQHAYLGLYNSAGALVASTADRVADALFAATTTGTNVLETAPLQLTYAAPAGLYWVAFLVVATTPCQIGRISVINNVVCNAGLSAAAGNLRFASYTTGGQTTLPGSFTPTSQLVSDNHAWWFGLS